MKIAIKYASEVFIHIFLLQYFCLFAHCFNVRIYLLDFLYISVSKYSIKMY